MHTPPPPTPRRGLLPSTPPGYKAGEPLYTSNHTTGIDTPVQRPPNAAGDRLPGWVLPVAVLLAGGDAASYLIDPALPLIAASTAAALVGTSVVGRCCGGWLESVYKACTKVFTVYNTIQYTIQYNVYKTYHRYTHAP